jgi:hypothetical protein
MCPVRSVTYVSGRSQATSKLARFSQPHNFHKADINKWTCCIGSAFYFSAAVEQLGQKQSL